MTTRATRTMSDERGFTLAEVLVATVVIVVGLVAVATGFQYGTSGVATGRGETTAAFLAEQRLEQLKTVAMRDYTDPALNAATTTEFCQSSNIGATASNCQATTFTGTATYQRVTTIADNPGGTGCDGTGTPARVCKRVRVTVTYRPLTSGGDLSQARQFEVFAILTPRS